MVFFYDLSEVGLSFLNDRFGKRRVAKLLVSRL